MIELQNLSKQFGTHRVVRDVSFRVDPGEVLGFLGPNGAGKSTTMKMLTGFLPPTAGTALVCGHDVRRAPQEAQRRIGYLPEGAPLYPDMTPASLLAFVAGVRDLRGAARRSRLDEVCSLVDISRVWRQRIETLSKGFKRRVGLAVALLHDPDVLVLDEPTDGLDPNQKREVRALIQRMSAGKTIILSTHILEEVEAVCTRSIILSDGEVRFDGTPAALRERSPHCGAVQLRLRGLAADGAARALSDLPGVDRVEATGEGLLVLPDGTTNLAESITAHACSAGWTIDSLHVEEGRLDEVFAAITEGGAA